MSLMSYTASLSRGRLLSIALTAALPLVPAFLVAGGTVFVAAARVDEQLGDATRGEAFAQRSRELPPDAPAEQRRDLLLQAREPGATRPLSATVTFAAAA